MSAVVEVPLPAKAIPELELPRRDEQKGDLQSLALPRIHLPSCQHSENLRSSLRFFAAFHKEIIDGSNVPQRQAVTHCILGRMARGTKHAEHNLTPYEKRLWIEVDRILYQNYYTPRVVTDFWKGDREAIVWHLKQMKEHVIRHGAHLKTDIVDRPNEARP